jgi:hypothetical protein
MWKKQSEKDLTSNEVARRQLDEGAPARDKTNVKPQKICRVVRQTDNQDGIRMS